MRGTSVTTMSLALLIGAAGVATAQRTTAQADTAREWNWHGRVASGKDLRIRGLFGSIVAKPARGSEVVVHALKGWDDENHRGSRRRSRRGYLSDVTINVEQSADGVTICAVYPGDEATGPNECPGDLRNGSRHSHSHNDGDNNVNVSVDFTVEVPAGVNFIGETVSGDIEADSMPANAEAITISGDVTLSARGHASATTINGDVRVAMGRTDWTGSAEFKTISGDVTVTLPADVNADVTATTMSGDISTDFPLVILGRFGPRRLHGKIGNGGVSLEFSTMSGDIKLLKR